MNPLKALQRKIQQVVSRAVVTIVNDGLKTQELQLTIMSDEVLDGVERFQNYGFTSHPRTGAEAITLSVNGHRSHTVAIAVDDKRYRLKGLKGGEVALYDDQGQKVVIYRDRIEVEAPKVVVKSSDVIVNSTKVFIDSDDINLGNGESAGLARVGDMVQIGSGSSAGLWPIVSGSNKVKSA
ncbi:phage baseplate assembly protein V [Pseudomonadota bacterium]|nr:phage baseplate assembly protein V [Pseudomonadota bacterium]